MRHKCRGKCANPDHLEVGTYHQNAMDKVRDGTDNRGEKHWRSQLTETQVLDIRSRVGQTQRQLGKEFGVSFQTISMICKGGMWKHLS